MISVQLRVHLIAFFAASDRMKSPVPSQPSNRPTTHDPRHPGRMTRCSAAVHVGCTGEGKHYIIMNAFSSRLDMRRELVYARANFERIGLILAAGYPALLPCFKPTSSA